jgi:hypothetical protein
MGWKRQSGEGVEVIVTMATRARPAEIYCGLGNIGQSRFVSMSG